MVICILEVMVISIQYIDYHDISEDLLDKEHFLLWITNRLKQRVKRVPDYDKAI